jgi:transposase
MRFVAVKSAEQQAMLMLLKVRALLVKQRTMLINAMRGHAAEFGVIAAKGAGKAGELLQQAHDAGAPALALEMLGVLSGQVAAIEARLKALEAELMAWHREDPVSQCLATQPGIGPIGAVSFTLKVSDPRAGTLPPGPASRPRRMQPPAVTIPAGSAGKATRTCAASWCSAPPR